MSMYGERAFELIKELERSKDSLPTFDENGLRQIHTEMDALYEQNQREMSAEAPADCDIEGLAGVQLRHSALERNKQCILSYLFRCMTIKSGNIPLYLALQLYCAVYNLSEMIRYNRLMRIRDVRWSHGSVLPHHIRLNTTDQEVQYFNSYNKILANYMRSIGDGYGLDLTQDAEPPKNLMVEVRVLEDYGEFETENGETVQLKKNSIHFLPRSQCEALTKEGVLEFVKS